jgi:hypothetical protein
VDRRRITFIEDIELQDWYFTCRALFPMTAENNDDKKKKRLSLCALFLELAHGDRSEMIPKDKVCSYCILKLPASMCQT